MENKYCSCAETIYDDDDDDDVVAVLNVASEEDVYPVNVSIRYNILGWLAATLCDK